MVDEKSIYNPATDSTDTQGTDNPLKELVDKQKAEQARENEKKRLEQASRQEFEKQVKEQNKNKPIKQSKEKEQAPFLSPGELLKRFKQQKRTVESIKKYQAEKNKLSGLSILKSRFAFRKADKLKVMKLQNMLMKKRLLNEIEKLKLQKQVASLRSKGKLPTIMPSIPMAMRPIYPMYADATMMGDIDSAFNADISTGENLYGGEDYYGGENFYPEDIYGDEFKHGDPLMELGIKIRNGVSPLLW